LGLTVEDVAKELLCSATKISRMETSQRRPSLRDVRDLCRIYHVDEATSAELMDLTRKAREPGWWTQYDDLAMPYIGLEEEASSITSFTMFSVPALLQTGDYARAIIKGIAPKIDPSIHEQRIEARLRRQQLLERDDPPTYRVLMDEAVLHRRVGSTAVMLAQLEKILKMEHSSKVTVQIIPFEVGAHAGQDSNFVLLDFSSLPSVAFVEGLTNHHYLDRKDAVSRYREAVDYLRDSALNPRESVKKIIEIRKEYNDDLPALM
jgi:transcriptional regulator with XRE-family HTH domain